MTGPQVAQQAKEQLSGLTGLQSDTVSSLGKADGGWQVAVEMIEMKRIPDSADILATYRAILDAEGNLLSYDRVRRYNRSQVTTETAEEGS